MTGLALVAGTQAILVTAPRVGMPVIVCPTVCFSFAVLLCWGLGPAVIAQVGAVAVVVVRLHRPWREAVIATGQYAVSFVAAACVLWVGQPDPFERDGPTNLVTDAISVVGSVAAWLAMFGLLALVSSRLRSPGIPRQGVSAIGNRIVFNAALLLLSPMIAVAGHINIGFVPLVFVPLFAVQRMARLSGDRDRAARTDPLTGLANRTALKANFDELTAGCDDPARTGRVTLLLLDLDRFKDVNDALGHDVGDQLLVAVAERIGALCPPDGTVARLGGDEFAILTVTSGVTPARALADRVVNALAEPVALERLRIDVTASVGIARHGAPADDFTTLMRHADVAMYEAKEAGDVVVYAGDGHRAGIEGLSLLTDFRQALQAGDRGQIRMHYQPQVSLRTGEVEGVEALLRWRHPEHGLVDTQELISIAEHTSVMHLLTVHVIDDVVAQLAVWNASGLRLRAAINVSVRDLYSDTIVTHLGDRLARYGVAPDQVQVEITESTLLADPVRAIATVARISALGVPVALDDFGTGYSSLQHLRKLPIAELKIDKSFVAGMAHNHDDSAIVRSMIDLARSLGIRTVAEGVENEYTRQLLADAGCQLAQGWLTAHPMPAEQVAPWLASYRAAGHGTGAAAAVEPAGRSSAEPYN